MLTLYIIFIGSFRNRSEDALSIATRARIAAWSDVSHPPAGINNSYEASNLQQPREGV